MTGDVENEARWEVANRRARRYYLAAKHGGMPESISPSDALALAATAGVPLDSAATADDVWASIYPNEAAADAWGESNLVNNGHPTLAKVPLPDGRVVGILDLRPEMEKSRARLRDPAWCDALERAWREVEEGKL